MSQNMRSFFTGEPVAYTEWVKELEENVFSENEILKCLEVFELCLVLIIRSTTQIHRLSFLVDWSMKKMEKTEELLSMFNPKSQIYKIFDCLINWIHNFNWGCGKSRKHTKQCYNDLNNLIERWFYYANKNKYFYVTRYLINSSIMSKKHAFMITRYSLGIKLLDIDFMQLINIVKFIERKKEQLKIVIEKSDLTKNNTEEVNERLKMYLENSFGDVDRKNLNEILKNTQTSNENEDQIKEKLEELQSSNSQIFLTLSELYDRLPAEIRDCDFHWRKLYLFALYPELYEIIVALQHIEWDKGIVCITDYGNTYCWNGMYGVLPYIMEKRKKQWISKKNKWEPFNLAFNMVNIEDHARK